MGQRIVYPERAQRYIADISSLMKFVAIAGFILICLAVFIILMIAADGVYSWYLASHPMSPRDEDSVVFPYLWISLLVAAAVYFVPCRRLWRSANAVAAIPDADGPYVTEEVLKSKLLRWRLIRTSIALVLCLEIGFWLLLALIASGGGTTA